MLHLSPNDKEDIVHVCYEWVVRGSLSCYGDVILHVIGGVQALLLGVACGIRCSAS